MIAGQNIPSVIVQNLKDLLTLSGSHNTPSSSHFLPYTSGTTILLYCCTMLNYSSSSGISPALLVAHALLLKSTAPPPPSSALTRLARRRLLFKPSLSTTRTTALPASILPFLKKHARQHDDADDSHSCTASYSSDDEQYLQNPAGKRQRRQAAATLVQNFPSWTGVGKKSKAQPRPQVLIPPKGIGPISEPNQNDVLCGRGGR